MSRLSNITDETFAREVLASDVPVLVDVYADWCGPCKSMLPTLEDVAGEFDGAVRFLKLDLDHCPATAKAYDVQSIPTYLIFSGGRQVERYSGVMSRSKLAKILTQHVQVRA
ncbi:thioredoxin [Caulobacter sp.]|uniref:thioredoxin n=1 Tax=Caulobacter sp. TaxID=78 RepID=UPI0031DEC78F